jgi:hypothetical protein
METVLNVKSAISAEFSSTENASKHALLELTESDKNVYLAPKDAKLAKTL